MKYKVVFTVAVSNEYAAAHVENLFNKMADDGYRLHSLTQQTNRIGTSGNLAVFEKIDPEAP
ncbi:hypothetical protein [Paenibacillus periandrae]|uniref:hypothetical protein n=1 Tax=Paenibacillus periandrae TaxID=1761741 RepID=UPI001F0945E2|nr:hypothetical protein [Paenibacillus periandrae]